MITLFQIDKSGRDIFEKDYSVCLIVNKNEAYGINVEQRIKEIIIKDFKNNQLWQLEDKNKDRTRLRVRFHSSIIILLIKEAIKTKKDIKNPIIEICNDFDGHFHEIKEMVFHHISPRLNTLRKEDIIQTKFQKPSKIDEIAKALSKKQFKGVTILKINEREIKDLMKRAR